MQLWLEAVDTDLESEREKDGRPRPHLTPSKERYSFLIVSENELLTEIGYEEEKLYLKLEDMLNRLLETQNKLNQVNLDLAAAGVKAENLGPMSARTEEIDQVLEKNQKVTEEVYTDYQRIRLELMTNRVDSRMIDRVEKTIVKPLGEIADFEFPQTRDVNASFRKALDLTDLDLTARLTAARAAGAQDKEQLRTLIGRVNAVLGAMQGVIDINKLIAVLRKIEEEEQKQFDQIKKVKDELELKLLEGALEGDKPK
jgi:hypothetical protein